LVDRADEIQTIFWNRFGDEQSFRTPIEKLAPFREAKNIVEHLEALENSKDLSENFEDHERVQEHRAENGFEIENNNDNGIENEISESETELQTERELEPEDEVEIEGENGSKGSLSMDILETEDELVDSNQNENGSEGSLSMDILNIGDALFFPSFPQMF